MLLTLLRVRKPEGKMFLVGEGYRIFIDDFNYEIRETQEQTPFGPYHFPTYPDITINITLISPDDINFLRFTKFDLVTDRFNFYGCYVNESYEDKMLTIKPDYYHANYSTI